MPSSSKSFIGWPVILFITASFVSNVGTWLFVVASSWLMTDINSSALMVSLVQSAATIPLFIFALPAGAIGDIFDRRKSLLIAQLFLTISTAVFAWIVYSNLTSAWLLLLFTFLNGIGAAFSRPMMAAIIPQIVDKVHLRTAVNLGGMSFNLSRSIGPAIGGYLITRFSISLPYWIDALTFSAVLIYLFFWKDDRPSVNQKDNQSVQLAIGDSWRFFRHTPALFHSIIKASAFFIAAGAFWALLPLIAKTQLSGNADLYGYLVGSAGVGAVLASFGLEKFTNRFGADIVLQVTSIIMSIGLILIGSFNSVTLCLAFAGICGVAWQSAYTTLMTSTQYSLPKWFGARGMAYYIMSVSFCLAVGSSIWGGLAEYFSISISLYASAGTILILSIISKSFRLDQAKDINLDAASESLFDYVANASSSDTKFNILIIKYNFSEELKEELINRLMSLKGSRYRSGILRSELYTLNNEIEEHILMISENNEIEDRHLTTEYDSKRQLEFLEWAKENNCHIEQRLLNRV